MKCSIPVHRELLGPHHPFHPLEKDWYGRPLPNWGPSGRPPEKTSGSPSAAFRFGLFNNVLTFEFQCSKPAYCDTSHPVGHFQAGLWQMDVAEFFVGSIEDSVYQEFNLSPAGAWWSATFTDYRQGLQEISPDQAQVALDSRPDGEGWRGRLQVNLSSLLPVARLGSVHQDLVDWSRIRLGVTAILFGQEPEVAPIYLSTGPQVEAEPDFHRPDRRLPVSFPEPQ